MFIYTTLSNVCSVRSSIVIRFDAEILFLFFSGTRHHTCGCCELFIFSYSTPFFLSFSLSISHYNNTPKNFVFWPLSLVYQLSGHVFRFLNHSLTRKMICNAAARQSALKCPRQMQLTSSLHGGPGLNEIYSSLFL